MKESTTRFSKKVEDYILYRPHYPAAMYDFLFEKGFLKEEDVVADLGSGTGISSIGFLKRGCKVYGVEPNDAMREAAERMFEDNPGFISINGTGEQSHITNQESQIIFVGQAFHWFDQTRARIEFQRILKPGGLVVLAWNDRKANVPFLDAYEALLQTHGTDYNEVNHRNTEASGFESFFKSGTFNKVVFDNPYYYDYRALEGRLLSCSYIPERGDVGFEPMMQELKRIFEKYQSNGKVPFGYDTRVYYGQV